MASGADRISELPDSVLVGILALLPMNEAARADILSRRWRGLFAEQMSIRRELDFVGDFRHHHSPQQFVEKVNLYLQLHYVSKLQRLHVSVDLPKSCWQDLERWVAFAARKGVEDLALDFTPNLDVEEEEDDDDVKEVFEIRSSSLVASRGYLRSIALTWCFLSPDFDFVHLGASLRCAYFRHSNMENDDVQSLLSRCPTLETLHFCECDKIESVVIKAYRGSGRRLKELVIANCLMLCYLAISAPCLRSFHIYGDLDLDLVFKDISNLEDALFSRVDRQTDVQIAYDPITMLQDVSHARVLTLCHSTLLIVSRDSENIYPGELPLTLFCLKELQLLLGVFHDEYLGYIYDFFRFYPMPQLERIFIRLPATLSETNHNIAAAARHEIDRLEWQFNRLKTVKLTNFFGTEPELKLIWYFLEHAPLLEKFVLVASCSAPPIARDGVVGEKLAFQVSKASSPVVELLFSGPSEDSSCLNPTHMETYDDESCTDGNM